MQEFGINDHKIIERWERIYLEEGPEGLAIERLYIKIRVAQVLIYNAHNTFHQCLIVSL